MEWNAVQTGWTDYQAAVKQRWSRIPDRVIETIGGDREQLLACVQSLYQLTPEAAERQLTDWQARLVRKRDPAA